jgi:hypothetical protein
LEKSFTPDIASSCTDPDRLLSLPLRCPSAPKPCCWSEVITCCCSSEDGFGALLVEVFFFVGTPNPKNLEVNFKGINLFATYTYISLPHELKRTTP